MMEKLKTFLRDDSGLTTGAVSPTRGWGGHRGFHAAARQRRKPQPCRRAIMRRRTRTWKSWITSARCEVNGDSRWTLARWSNVI